MVETGHLRPNWLGCCKQKAWDVDCDRHEGSGLSGRRKGPLALYQYALMQSLCGHSAINGVCLRTISDECCVLARRHAVLHPGPTAPPRPQPQPQSRMDRSDLSIAAACVPVALAYFFSNVGLVDPGALLIVTVLTLPLIDLLVDDSDWMRAAVNATFRIEEGTAFELCELQSGIAPPNWIGGTYCCPWPTGISPPDRLCRGQSSLGGRGSMR